MSKPERFPLGQVALRPVQQRGHDLLVEGVLPLSPPTGDYVHEDLPRIAQAIVNATANKRAVIAIIGGHVIKLGLARFLIDLMEKGFVTHLATNGSGVIHDFELARCLVARAKTWPSGFSKVSSDCGKRPAG